MSKEGSYHLNIRIYEDFSYKTRERVSVLEIETIENTKENSRGFCDQISPGFFVRKAKKNGQLLTIRIEEFDKKDSSLKKMLTDNGIDLNLPYDLSPKEVREWINMQPKS